ncbi:hypothetical protein FDUTEX481_09312 [Tolypothrix sp. PCC 7601]|nr:hypothetical protein FDUTEX481_09312 [Tolypothrix sp. PCC 7601]
MVPTKIAKITNLVICLKIFSQKKAEDKILCFSDAFRASNLESFLLNY